MKRFVGNALLVVASIAVGLLMMEGAIRLIAPQPTEYFYFKAEEKPGDTFTRWGDIEVSINSHGHRDREYPLDKGEDVFRIAVLGDSVAYGTGVALEDTYAKQLESRLNAASQGPRFEVMSFSAGGDDIRGYLEMMREDAVRFAPDLYLLGFTLNDFVRPLSKPAEPTLRRRLYDLMRDTHAFMRIHSHLYFLTMERSRTLLYKYKIIDKSVRRNFELQTLETEGEAFWTAWDATQKLLDEAQAEAQRQGSDYAVLVFPYEMQLNPDLLAVYRDAYGFALSDDVLTAKPQRLLHAFYAERQVPFIDLFEAFRGAAADGTPLYFRELGGSLDWVHPNATGYGVAADVLARELACRNLVPEVGIACGDAAAASLAPALR